MALLEDMSLLHYSLCEALRCGEYSLPPQILAVFLVGYH